MSMPPIRQGRRWPPGADCASPPLLLLAVDQQRLELADALHLPLFLPLGDDRLRLFELDRTRVEQDVAAPAGLVSEQIEQLGVGQPAVLLARGVGEEEL